MKLHTLAMLSVATLVSAGPAFALNVQNNSGPEDATGMTTLGVDITRAGGSATSVGAFLAQLSPETRDSVLAGCHSALNGNDASFNSAVIGFCRNATGRVSTAYMPNYAQQPNGLFGAPYGGYRAGPSQRVAPKTVPMGETSPSLVGPTPEGGSPQ